jgi:hypothetical protein
MGYLIKEAANIDLVKIETNIKAADMQQLSTLNTNDGYQIATIKPGYIFCPVTIMLQVNGTIAYSSFAHIWLWQGGGSPKIATYGKTGVNTLQPGAVANFIVNIDHGTTAQNQFGVKTEGTRDIFLKMNIDDTSGDGNGFLTIYGYYIPDFI